MVTALNLYFKLQKKLHNTRTLHILNLLALSGQIGFLAGAFLAYSIHMRELVGRYGLNIVLLGFIPYILVGFVAATVLLFLGKKNLIFLVVLMILSPTALLTESGMNALTFSLIAYLIRRIELGHRRFIVSAVAGFSEKYSPLYEKRLANKRKYKEYVQAYTILDFFDADDFILLDELDEKYTNKKLGVYERKLTRTFKIKGVWGKVKVSDDLFIAPQKRSIFTRLRKGVRYFG